MAGSSSCHSFTTDFREEKNNKPLPLYWQIEREYFGWDHQVPRCVNERPMDARNLGQHPSKSPATKRLRGSSARSLFSTETWDDTFEAFPLVFTAVKNIGLDTMILFTKGTELTIFGQLKILMMFSIILNLKTFRLLNCLHMIFLHCILRYLIL